MTHLRYRKVVHTFLCRICVKRVGSQQYKEGSMAKKKAKKVTKKAAPKKSAKKPVATSEDSLMGKSLPEFALESTTGSRRTLSDLNGKVAVIYFYPRDNTPGCTLEGHDFRRLHKEFQKAGAEIYGVSRDSIKSHLKFVDGCGFTFELLSDPEDKLMRPLKVIGEKSMYGKKFEGIIRSTFVVGADGKIKKVWRNVKVAGHAEEVLNTVKGL